MSAEYNVCLQLWLVLQSMGPCQTLKFKFGLVCLRLREDIAKEVGFVETNLAHYTGNQWREFFRMLPATAESLLREVAPFLADAENRKICLERIFTEPSQFMLVAVFWDWH